MDGSGRRRADPEVQAGWGGPDSKAPGSIGSMQWAPAAASDFPAGSGGRRLLLWGSHPLPHPIPFSSEFHVARGRSTTRNVPAKKKTQRFSANFFG